MAQIATERTKLDADDWREIEDQAQSISDSCKAIDYDSLSDRFGEFRIDKLACQLIDQAENALEALRELAEEAAEESEREGDSP